MAVPYTTREMAKKIAEEVVKEHGGGGGSSYTAGNGIKIENNEIEVDDEVVATIEDFMGIPFIQNVKGLVVGNPESEFGAFMIGEGKPMMLATDGNGGAMFLSFKTTPGNGPVFSQSGGGTGGYDVDSEIPVMEFTVVTFIQTSSGVECPLSEENRKNLFKRIKTQVENESYQFPIWQLMRVQESGSVQGMTSTIKVSYNENDPTKVFFEFSGEGIYELTNTGDWELNQPDA